MVDIIGGKVKFFEFREVEIEDLLGCDLVELKFELMVVNIINKVVMVIGVGGFIGFELCR